MAGGEQFAIEDDRCSGTTLPAGHECTVRARFDPLRTGPASAQLTFVDDAPGPDAQVPLLGVGTAPDVGVSPPDKAYGAQLVGTTSGATTFTATNSGTAPLHVRNVSLTGHDRDHFDVTSTNCPGATVAPGGTCTANVVFKPIDVGSQTAELAFTDDANGGEQRVPLSGFGIAPAIGVAPNARSFDEVQVGSASTPAGFTATNTGGADLTIQSVGMVGGSASQFALPGNTCGGVTLHPGESCTVQARFQPTDEGLSSAFVAFTDNATGGQTRVGVVGFGTQPGAAITPDTADLGSVQVDGRGPTVPLTLSDEGTAPLHVSSVALGGADAGDVAIASDGCSGQTLSLGSLCTVLVQLAPGSAGQKSATLQVSDDAPNSPQSAALSGSASSAAAGPSPAPPPPSPPAPPPVNVPLVPPTLASLVLRSASVRVDASGGFALPVRCDAAPGERCEGTLTLTTPKATKKKKRGKRAASVRQAQVAAGRFSLSPGRGSIRMRLKRSWLAKLKRTRRLPTTATALTRRAGAAAARDTARVVLLAPERKKKKSKRR